MSDREVAAKLAAYDVVSLAVIDEVGRLVGAVTIDDVLDRVLPVQLARSALGDLMARRDDLSTPRGSPGGPVLRPGRVRALAEQLARFFGTAATWSAQTILVVIWIAINMVAVIAAVRDPYPFILLNLAFSTQAAYAAPLILLAQNRQADREREDVERDRAATARALAETEYLAREIAAVRLAVEQKADRDELLEPWTA